MTLSADYREVPESDVAKWRVLTVRMATKAFPKDRKSLYRAEALYKTLTKEFEALTSSPESEAWRKAKDAIDDLTQMAHELAMTLRASEARYEWTQDLPVSSVPAGEFERISGFNMRSKTAPVRPVLILFGSVIKISDGERNVLRMGDLIEGEPLGNQQV